MLDQCFLSCLPVQINTASEELNASAQWNVDKRSSCQAKHGASHGFPSGPGGTDDLDSQKKHIDCAKGWELNQRCGITWCLGLLYLPSGKLSVCELENQHQSTINVRFSIAVQLPEGKSWHLFSHRVWEAPQTSPARLELLE